MKYLILAVILFGNFCFAEEISEERKAEISKVCELIVENAQISAQKTISEHEFSNEAMAIEKKIALREEVTREEVLLYVSHIHPFRSPLVDRQREALIAAFEQRYENIERVKSNAGWSFFRSKRARPSIDFLEVVDEKNQILPLLVALRSSGSLSHEFVLRVMEGLIVYVPRIYATHFSRDKFHELQFQWQFFLGTLLQESSNVRNAYFTFGGRLTYPQK